MTCSTRPAAPALRRDQLDLSLYLVTDTAQCGAAGVVATAAAAVAAGVSIVQLRDPHATDRELVRAGRDLVAALEGTGVPLLVNDRVDLVAAIGADGAHVGQGDAPVARAREMLGPQALLGLSVQTLAHVAAALELPPGVVDYLGVGPVWAQGTKPDAASPGGLELLRDIVTASPWPCVAIGGVDAAHVPPARVAGVAGVAVVSAICGQPDVGAATRRLRAAWSAGATTGMTRGEGHP